MRFGKVPSVVRWIAVCLFASSAGVAGAPPARDDAVTPAVQASVLRGLSYLARQQQPDGSFTGLDEPGPRIAPAAEVMLAYLSAGQGPRVGRYALSMRNVIEFVLRQLPDDGGFGAADGSGSEGQAMITIALAECYGFETDSTARASLREALDRSKQYILAGQDQKQGGWVADGKRDADLVTTFWMTLSLHALADAGMDIPPASLERAAAFALVRQKVKGSGFADQNAETSPASNAAALVIIRLSHANGGARISPALKYLVDQKPDAAKADFHTALYIDTVAAFLWGEPSWTLSWKGAMERLISKQTEDGSWFPPVAPAIGLGTVSATAKAVMTLTVPYRLLPLYEH
jgi:hypothetical protein